MKKLFLLFFAIFAFPSLLLAENLITLTSPENENSPMIGKIKFEKG